MNLFDPLTLRGIRLRNRIGVSPMCQYSAVDGLPQPWHLVHLGSRAVGGAGLVLAEATAVDARGRISPFDTGIWNDEQASAWAPIATFIAAQGAVPGIQLAHAGRKASTEPPWSKKRTVGPEQGGWIPVAPSAIPYSSAHSLPQALEEGDIDQIIENFRTAACRSAECGFQLIEIHAAHGYLLHQFLSPLSNQRADHWGGSFENRIRLTRTVAASVRSAMPDSMPLLLRISATDWAVGGWDIEQSVELAKRLKADGVDMIDVSSGGLVLSQAIEIGPGYQVPFASRIRGEAGVATATVGLITKPAQAAEIVADGAADLVLLGRELLRDPYWPRRAAKEFGTDIEAPLQYARAWH
ncbi:MAG: NADH:flavin oxidoreductase/NADH oxidase [Burkholderiales bacterium]|nr:NADH:flavin oxidoreductase/NADH oxidase [Burkholderiales bacterium]